MTKKRAGVHFRHGRDIHIQHGPEVLTADLGDRRCQRLLDNVSLKLELNREYGRRLIDGTTT